MRETLLDGSGDPKDPLYHSFFLSKPFGYACSIESVIEERLDPTVGRGVTEATCRAWLTVGLGRADWPIELMINGTVE